MLNSENLIIVGLLVLLVGVVLFFLAFLGLIVRPLFYIIFIGGGCFLVLIGILWTAIHDW